MHGSFLPIPQLLSVVPFIVEESAKFPLRLGHTHRGCGTIAIIATMIIVTMINTTMAPVGLIALNAF